MSKALTNKEKKALEAWDKLVRDILAETIVEDLSPADIQKKRKELEADPVAWIYYMFPKAAKYKFAKFHIKAIRRIIDNNDWYEVLSWSRELAKSTTVCFIVLHLVMTGKLRNIILASATQDSAERLLRPYRAHLENNQRIKQFYGEQKGSLWTSTEFVTKKGVSFIGVGAGNAPRGSKNDDIRPDCLLIDDFDTDEDCRNEEIIKKKWEWWEQALYFTRSMSEPLRTIWCGNIIAKDCCITRAGAKARELAKRKKPLGNWDIINLRMVNINKPDPQNDYQHGTSVWIEKNSEEQIDIVQAQVSAASVQKECYNNPVSEGETFKEITWGKVPPLRAFPFLVCYSDPAPSNNTKTKANSYKASFLLGILEGKLYIITGYLDRVTNAEFVEWYYYVDKYVDDRNQVYNYIENNKLQDPFYEQVFIPLFAQARKNHNKIINISPDERKKPDKFARIEGNLEPLNRQGNLILNEAEKGNPHMQRLEEQFLMVNPRLTAPADGVDCVEGGFFVANQKMSALAPNAITFGTRNTNNKRY